MSERLVDEVIGNARGGKPRENGITVVSDHFGAMDEGLLGQIADYIDFAKIGLSIPLMVEGSKLVDRIRRYHDHGIKVLSGGTLIEVAVQKGVVSQVLERLRALGFDMVEVSELAGDIPTETKREILSETSRLSMEYVFEAAGQDSRSTSAGRIISKIQEAFELKSRKVIVGIPREGRGAAQSDSQGEIAWDRVNEIVGMFGPPNLIFEAPQMSQRTALILEFGPAVNLAGVPTDEILTLEMQRLGLTTETLGLSRPPQGVDGSPAIKFVYHLVRTQHPIDQVTLTRWSGLPRRTVQAALSHLVDSGLISEVSDTNDMRRHRYTIK